MFTCEICGEVVIGVTDVWSVAPIFVEIVATLTQRRSSALFASKPKPCTSCTQRKNVVIGEAANRN